MGCQAARTRAYVAAIPAHVHARGETPELAAVPRRREDVRRIGAELRFVLPQVGPPQAHGPARGAPLLHRPAATLPAPDELARRAWRDATGDPRRHHVAARRLGRLSRSRRARLSEF